MASHLKCIKCAQLVERELFRDGFIMRKRCKPCRDNLISTVDRVNELKLSNKFAIGKSDTIINTIKYDEYNIEKMRDCLYMKYKNKEYRTGITAGIFGSTKSGKSYLLTNIIKTLENSFDIIILFTINASNIIFDDLRDNPKFLIFDSFNGRLVEKCHDINEALPRENRPSILFVLDDMIDGKNDKILRNMLMTYRNANLSTLICSQAYSIVNKQSRANMNFVFLGKFNNDESRRDIVSIYLNGNPKFHSSDTLKKNYVAEMMTLYDVNTRNHKFIIVDICDDIYTYTAP